jgi:hypothetical protein
MKRTVIFYAVAHLCCACGTTKYVSVESTKIEYRDNFVRDSNFRYDSVLVKQTADTMFFERYNYLYWKVES